MIHDLKTDPEPFDAVARGAKTFEIRRADRPFDVLDILRLRETRFTGRAMADGAELVYTGREVAFRVTHILRGPCYGLAEGWCILSGVIVLQDKHPLGDLERHDLNAYCKGRVVAEKECLGCDGSGHIKFARGGDLQPCVVCNPNGEPKPGQP